MSSRSSTTTALTVAGLSIVGGFIAYAAYFDYKRRNDPSFRKKIRSQKKRVQQHVEKVKEERAAEQSAGQDQIPKELIQALHEKAQEEALPDDADERHQYFINLVGQAEMIAAQGPEVYLEASIYFYRALRAYPSKEDLITIYSKSIPLPVFMIVMQLHNLDVSGRPNVVENDEVSSLDGSETNQESRGPPSETSSQEWDQVTDPGNTPASD